MNGKLRAAQNIMRPNQPHGDGATTAAPEMSWNKFRGGTIKTLQKTCCELTGLVSGGSIGEVARFLIQPYIEEQFKLYCGSQLLSFHESNVFGETHDAVSERLRNHGLLTSTSRKLGTGFGGTLHLFANLCRFFNDKPLLMMRGGGRGRGRGGRGGGRQQRNRQRNVPRNRDANNLVVAALADEVQRIQGEMDGLVEARVNAQAEEIRPEEPVARAPREPEEPEEVEIDDADLDELDANRLNTDNFSFSHDPKVHMIQTLPRDTLWNRFLGTLRRPVTWLHHLLEPMTTLFGIPSVFGIFNMLMDRRHQTVNIEDSYVVTYDRERNNLDVDMRCDVHKISKPTHTVKYANVTSTIVTEFEEVEKFDLVETKANITEHFMYSSVTVNKTETKNFRVDLELFSQLISPNICVHGTGSDVDFETKSRAAVRFVKRSTETNRDRYENILSNENIADNTLHLAKCYYRWSDSNQVSNVSKDFRAATHREIGSTCCPTDQERSRILQNHFPRRNASNFARFVMSYLSLHGILKWSVRAFMLTGFVYLMWTPKTLFLSLTALGTGWVRLCLLLTRVSIESYASSPQGGARLI